MVTCYTNPFLSIPRKKIDDAIEDIKNVHLDFKTNKLSPSGSLLLDMIDRYANANIQVDYWFREMDNFEGDPILVDIYNGVIKNVKQTYRDGVSYCFAGAHGRGKTLTASCILKRAVESGSSGLYVNLVDIINIMTSGDSETKSEAKNVLLSVDFLVIDEFDSRFMGTENAANLFGRILEPIIRSRIQNKLPIFICTNSTDPASSFEGALQQSFKSLMNKIKLEFVSGSDYRKKS